MPSVADCLRQHAPAYYERFGSRIALRQRQVLEAIVRCRTGELGSVVVECDGCGRRHWVGRSCGNRHCPTCQHHKTQAWLQKQSSRLLPAPHFLVTFTVPESVRAVMRVHPRAGYTALFASGRGTLRALAGNERWLGTSKVGFFGVLHTWGRDPMVYHPHVHFVMAGGGVSEDGSRWLSTRSSTYLFPHAALCRVYRAKFADALREAGLYDDVPASVWETQWVVDVKAVGDGRAVLKYLAPYVHRVALSDSRIEACDEDSVTYRWTPSGKKRARRRTVAGVEFVRGFAQHVLPRGFQKVRYYGWMSPNNRLRREAVRWLLWLHLGWVYWLASGRVPPVAAPPASPRCDECGGRLQVILVTDADGRTLWHRPLANHRTPYLDSG